MSTLARPPTATLLLSLALMGCGSDVGNDAPGTGGTGNSSVTTGGAGGMAGATGGSVTHDAGPDVSDAGAQEASDEEGSVEPSDEAGISIARLLNAKAPECWACAQAGCANYITGCATLSGTAQNGPASGERKSALCIETLACVLPTGCAANDLAACYCGTDHPDPDFNCDRDSTCSHILERSLESTDPLTVLISMNDQTKGGGWAMALMQCLRDNQCAPCLTPPPDEGGTDGGDPDAQSSDGESLSARLATQKSQNRHTQRLIGSPQ